MSPRHLVILLALSALRYSASAATPTPGELAFFETHVRPVLADRCYKCHSAEHGKAKGDLLLDTREGIRKGGESGPAVVPGDPEKSLLVKAIEYHDPDMQMPPSKEGGKLQAETINRLRQWVKMGAPDPRDEKTAMAKATGKLAPSDPWKHWAFQPVKKPAEPSVANRAWVVNPIDAFVLQKLEQQNLKPNPPASKETWLRRVTFDLIGLPPTPAELAAFQADTSPKAREKVIDRLLASPHYGERWGRHWLDTARYADTIGDEQLARRIQYRFPYAWTYRDYVIESLNADKPWNTFLTEQLAADLLPDAKEDDPRLAALGFLTVGQRFPMPNDTINERIDTVTKATMSLTVACARCHDHFFDPVPTEDYYSLHGIFSSIVEPTELPRIATGGDAQKDFEQKLAALELKNREVFANYVREYNGSFRTRVRDYLIMSLYGRRDSTFAGRPATPEDLAMMRASMKRVGLDEDAVRYFVEHIAGNRGRFHLDLFAPWKDLAFLPEEGWADKAAAYLAKLGEGGKITVNPYVVKALKGAKPRDRMELADLYARVFAGLEKEGEAWVATGLATRTEELPHADPAKRALLDFPLRMLSAARLTTEELQTMVAGWPNQFARRNKFKFDEITTLKLTHEGSPAHAMVVKDAPKPRDSNVLIRGEAQSKGDVVPRRFLEVIAGKDRSAWREGSGRLELARAITDPANPLTARSAVNRVWMHHFGEGIVPTPEDLGVMSDAPSHPELLDWLAATFAEQGWSMKKLHRQILLSNAYAQSSDVRADGEAKDPFNRYLWRANLRRLDFEAIRDSMLVFSGDLDPRVGGKPINLTEEPYSYRRSVYGFIDRGNVPELMSQFDFSDPDMANSKRTTTVVPQQALFMMNSPMAIDVARRIVEREEVEKATTDEARIAAIFRIVLQRAPRDVELTMARIFLENAAAEVAPSAPAAKGAKKPRGPDYALETKRAEKKMEDMMKRREGRTIRNDGEIVERKPLTPLEAFAQALMFTNEVVYIN